MQRYLYILERHTCSCLMWLSPEKMVSYDMMMVLYFMEMMLFYMKVLFYTCMTVLFYMMVPLCEGGHS